ncbi:MAG TPA: hypothetical protein PKJ00_01355 [Verrucomicrobiota bacterium]|nr:hypothetical protein [Verrucomicrobiota bacterium]HNS68701.1 hypothetical protein [Verrucomicrobiota bacterium]
MGTVSCGTSFPGTLPQSPRKSIPFRRPAAVIPDAGPGRVAKIFGKGLNKDHNISVSSIQFNRNCSGSGIWVDARPVFHSGWLKQGRLVQNNEPPLVVSQPAFSLSLARELPLLETKDSRLTLCRSYVTVLVKERFSSSFSLNLSFLSAVPLHPPCCCQTYDCVNDIGPGNPAHRGGTVTGWAMSALDRRSKTTRNAGHERSRLLTRTLASLFLAFQTAREIGLSASHEQ